MGATIQSASGGVATISRILLAAAAITHCQSMGEFNHTRLKLWDVLCRKETQIYSIEAWGVR